MSFLKLDLKTEYRNQHIDVLNEFYLSAGIVFE